MFTPDQPISTSSEDILGRAPFAKSLAEAVLNYQDKSSIVTGLYGGWGTGKSSVVNMCLEHISARAEELKPEEKPIGVQFNPWNFSDQNQLIFQFFKQLSLALKKKDESEELNSIAERLDIYAEFFGMLSAVPEPTVGILSGILGKLTSQFSARQKKLAELKALDLEAMRAELNDLLAQQGRKIIIVIDDIDRLPSIEVRQIFQLVKMLGDFPNTIYLLSFDAQVVVESLKDVQHGKGQEYLEKIVQIPFELPKPNQSEVLQFLLQKLSDITADLPDIAGDDVYFANIFHSGFKNYFKNLRDVTRYINSLEFGLGIIKDNVKLEDYIAITSLQVFEPDVYQGIRDNKDVFSGLVNESFGSDDTGIVQAKSRCDEVLKCSRVLTESRLQEFLTQLFPKLEKLYGNMSYDPEFLSKWRGEGRICSPDNFDFFFQLSFLSNDISPSEVKSILALAAEYEKFEHAVDHLNKIGRIVRFLDRLQDYVDDKRSEEEIVTIIRALLQLGDQFPEGRGAMFSLTSVRRIAHLTTGFLKGYSQNERFDILRNTIDPVDQSIFSIVNLVRMISGEHAPDNDRKLPPEERFVTEDQSRILEGCALNKIRSYSEKPEMLSHRDLLSVLYRWRDFTGSLDEPRAYIGNHLEMAADVINVVKCFVSEGRTETDGDYIAQASFSIRMNEVIDFLDVEKLMPQVRHMAAAGGLPAEDEKAIQLFVDTYDGKVEEF